MARFNSVERFAVNHTEYVVLQLGWIFREQSILDMGIDAIIEEAHEGNPTGKFIALQIKGGNSNFNISENTITYYVSHIHRNYWLSLSLPILLIVYLPITEQAYWYQITENNLIKTDTRWKIEIPKTHVFNAIAKPKIARIFPVNNNRRFAIDLFEGSTREDTIFDNIEKIECLSESRKCMLNIASLFTEYSNIANKFTTKFNEYIDKGLSDKHSQVKASLKNYGVQLNSNSNRLALEIELFAELFSNGFYSYERVVETYHILSKDNESINAARTALETIPSSVENTLKICNDLRESIMRMPTKYPVLNEARTRLLSIIDSLNFELQTSASMAENALSRLL